MNLFQTSDAGGIYLATEAKATKAVPKNELHFLQAQAAK